MQLKRGRAMSHFAEESTLTLWALAPITIKVAAKKKRATRFSAHWKSRWKCENEEFHGQMVSVGH
jgi:hypothetical protein